MKKEFEAGHLNVPAFAQAGGALEATQSLGDFSRLQAEAAATDTLPEVHWSARGEMRPGPVGAAVPWLHLEAAGSVPLICQRCLQPMQVPVQVDRWFRFVANEETAALEDEEADEDVLVVSRSFDLQALIEDELLMEMPAAPRHDRCPQAVPMSAQDADFEAASEARPNPFAALQSLRKKPAQGD